MPIRGVSCIVLKLEFYNPIWSDQGKMIVFAPSTVCLTAGSTTPLSPSAWGAAQKVVGLLPGFPRMGDWTPWLELLEEPTLGSTCLAA